MPGMIGVFAYKKTFLNHFLTTQLPNVLLSQ